MPSHNVNPTSRHAAVRLAAALGMLGVAGCVFNAAGGFGASEGGSFTTYVYPLTFLPGAALCLMWAKLGGPERVPWALVGIGYL